MKAALSSLAALALACAPLEAQVIGSGVHGGDTAGMITPVLARASGIAAQPSTSAASFGSIVGGQGLASWSITRTARTVPFPINGTVSNIKAYFPTALSQGSYNVTLNINNSIAPFTCTIDTTHQTCTDDVSTANITAGQLVAIETVPTSTPTAQTNAIQVSFEFKSSAPNESFICAHAITAPSNSAQNWTAFGGVINFGTSEIAASSILPIAGALDHFYVLTSTTIATGSWDFIIYKNGSASALDTGAISSGTTGNDLTHSVSISALDTISLSSTPASTPTTGTFSACARWMPTTKGKAVVINVDTTVPPVTSNAIRFGNLAGAFANNAAQTDANNIIPTFATSFTISDFVVAESTAPGAGATRALEILSGTPGGTINTACGLAATITNSSTLTIGGVANTPAIQDSSTNCAQTAGNSVDVRVTNSATANAAVTWFKHSASVSVR